MTETITIGALSKATGVSTKTIRFYEEVGLLTRAIRAENGYRMYPNQAISELSLIKYTRELGLPIPKIKRLMQGCENHDCAHSKDYIEKELSEYQTVLDQKIHELAILKKRIRLVAKNLKNLKTNRNGEYCCNILGYMAKQGKGGE